MADLVKAPELPAAEAASASRLSRRAVVGGGLSLAMTSLLGAGAATARADDGPLRIGVLLDTSGPASIHGKRQLLGVLHQAELINLGAGRDRTGEVRLLVRDTQGRVDVTSQHAETLLTRDGVDALIGTSMPATAEALMSMAQAAG